MATGTIREQKWKYVGLYSDSFNIPFPSDADELFFYGSKTETGGWETVFVHVPRPLFDGMTANIWLASTGYSSRLTVNMNYTDKTIGWNKTSSSNADVNYVRVYKR